MLLRNGSRKASTGTPFAPFQEGGSKILEGEHQAPINEKKELAAFAHTPVKH